jgi:D-inositol-3-phosphate glycosyltransferase
VTSLLDKAMSNLRIAMLSVHSCPLGQLGTRDTGGMNVYVRELSRELGALGHRVDIYTRAHDPRDAQMESPYENVRLIHIQAGRVEDMGKMAQLSHLQEFTRNMSDFIASDGATYDVIHSHYWLSGLAGRQFGEAWGVPQVTMFHTLGAIKNSLPVGEKESGIRLNAEHGVVRASRRIVAATGREKTQLINSYGARADRISVVPCGVNIGVFQPMDRQAARRALGLGTDDKVILSVGRIEPLKGLDRLIEGFSRLRLPGLKLIIIGGDEFSEKELARLKTLAGDLGVGGKVAFPGTVKQDRLPLYYSAANVSVVASYYESFCLIILESLACGTPVVSTDVGVASQVIVEGVNGAVVAGGEAAALARGIEQIIMNPRSVSGPILISASAAGYSWQAVAARIAGVYKSAITPAPVLLS